VITKHPDTGGLVSPGTVTAQLLYEIATPEYLNPDVVAHFDTIRLDWESSDRVRISGTRGSPPPSELKVAVNYFGGYRNTMTLVLTGLDIEEKAAWAQQQLFETLGGKASFDDVDIRLIRFDHQNAPSNEQATAHLRITVKDQDPRKVGRAFSNATMELALGGYPGFHTTTPPTAQSAYGVYWPAAVPAKVVRQRVVLPDGTSRDVEHTPSGELSAHPKPDLRIPPIPGGPTRRVPLGRICAARSGDKGGNANVGIWARDSAGYAWLREYLGVARLRELLSEAANLVVHRYELPNLHALNFVLVGLLGHGVAASTRPDPQAKGLGEYLRSRHVDVPESLLPSSAE
jgi:hypothetical protein